MENQNKQLRKEIGDKHNASFGKRGIRLPSGINFFIDKPANTITMKLSKESVCKNMQEDSVAFEGWAIVVKHWTEYEKVILEWEDPGSSLNKIKEKSLEDKHFNKEVKNKMEHYQRFLFRVKNFKEHFKSWFYVSVKCETALDKLEIKNKEKYLLNPPGERKNTVQKTGTSEAALELRFINPKDKLHDNLVRKTNAKFIERQLPVGVFKNGVEKQKLIFTGGKSAIDLWGENNDGDLLIFELKKGNNYKVGIISELYFYVCIMLELRKGNFYYKFPNEKNVPKTNSKKLRAYFLTPELHPLIQNNIDFSIITELNRYVPDTSFHFLKIELDESLSLLF